MKTIQRIVLTVACVGLWTACTSPAWEEHYASRVDEILADDLMQKIDAHPEMSEFAKLLRAVGYDKLLSQSQSYTVWAPTNQALQHIDATDTDYLKVFLKNHISRFPYPTSSITGSEEYIHMLDNKVLPFTHESNSFYFGNQLLKEKDLLARNGILHLINGYEDYVPNIWEYMSRPGYDSIYAFLNRFERYVFNERGSVVLGVENGETIYDSVFYYHNTIIDEYMNADIKEEDKVYTFIMPTNEAWTEMYDSIRSYLNYSPFYTNAKGELYENRELADSLQQFRVKTMLVSDLAFDGQYDPDDLRKAPEMTATSGTLISRPTDYFAGMSPTEVSNGLVYVADHLNFSPQSWCKPRIIEAERFNNHYYGNAKTPEEIEAQKLEMSQRNLYARETYASKSKWAANVSQSGYLEVAATQASARPSVSFELANLMSTAYNIYCVFVPVNINRAWMKPADMKPTKVSFAVSYTNMDGGISTMEYRTAREIDPTRLDTVLVTRDDEGLAQPIRLPYANALATLKVESAVDNSTELDTHEKDMLIDCIIVEPVYSTK